MVSSSNSSDALLPAKAPIMASMSRTDCRHCAASRARVCCHSTSLAGKSRSPLGDLDRTALGRVTTTAMDKEEEREIAAGTIVGPIRLTRNRRPQPAGGERLSLLTERAPGGGRCAIRAPSHQLEISERNLRAKARR